MARNDSKSIPKFASLDELVEYFDSHDLGDHLEQSPDAEFEIVLKKSTHLIALEKGLALKLSKIAKAKKVSSQKLVNTWLKEKIQKPG